MKRVCCVCFGCHNERNGIGQVDGKAFTKFKIAKCQVQKRCLRSETDLV